MDGAGNLYMPEYAGHRVRKVAAGVAVPGPGSQRDVYFVEESGAGHVLDSTGRHTTDSSTGVVLYELG